MNVSARCILGSGVIGIFPPFCLTGSIAALTAQAGESLYWRPSLYWGFDWALVAARRFGGNGPNTFTVTRWAINSMRIVRRCKSWRLRKHQVRLMTLDSYSVQPW